MTTASTRRWIGTALAVAAVGVCLLVAGVLGLWSYMGSTARALHPVAGEIQSVARATPAPRWTEAARRGQAIVRAALSEQNLPGMSVAVGFDRDIVWAEGFGWADVDRKTPVVPETTFGIGTASVVLTSAAVGLLVERGQLSLDDPILRHVPAFPQTSPPVTLAQVMGHMAGVRDDGGDEGPLLSVHCERPSDALPHFADRPLIFEPGSRFGYSSYGWILVSAAVEAVAGEPFLRFMRKQVFEPLAMDDTRADASPGPMPARATSYFPRFAADPRYGADLLREVDHSCYAGASVFVSTPSDLVRFGLAMNGETLLQRGTLERLQTSGTLPSGEGTGYGLGWDLESVTMLDEDTRWVGHEGDVLGGRVASMLTFPTRGLTVSVVANMSYADTTAVAVRIAAAFAQDGTSSAQ